ncbi:MAG: mechanosensitive ion channel family protein, partial [Nitrospinaceae bacterium]
RQSLKTLALTDEDQAAEKKPAHEKLALRLDRLRDKYDPELVKFNLEKARQDLEQALSSDESLVESAAKRIKTFFKTRGRNLLVTIATIFGLWWGLTRIRKWVTGKKFLSNLNPRLGKLFTAAYNILVLIVSLLAGLACLYFFNDWLLISLAAMIFILGIWTSRQWIPKFLQEIKLIVNLGTVRENERLIWLGLPWLVKDIGLEATLVNERLEGGEIKLHLSELIGKHSRPVVDNEPWFPTRTDDWVILPDNSYGRVENQTLEQVVLRLKGGALKYYSTSRFLEQNPMNISDGFRYCIEFGLDYGVQSKVCEEIPGLFENGLRKHLKKSFDGASPDFNFLEVSFDNAGPSSLNLMIIIHVDGRCADRYEENRREIQSALVAICNENGLVIPFNRLTINLAGDESGKTVKSDSLKAP